MSSASRDIARLGGQRDMSKTKVRSQHFDAMAHMDQAQVGALRRINEAFHESRSGNCSAKDMLEARFKQEVRTRSEASGD